MRNSVTGLLCSALFATVVSAQAVGDLTTGQRLRVSSEKRLTGTFVSADSTSLVLNAGSPSGEVRLPLDQIRLLEVSNGRRSRLATVGRSVLACVSVGAVFGVMQQKGFFSTGDLAAMGAIAGGAVGIVVGLVRPRRERWAPVSLPVSERLPSSVGANPGPRVNAQWPSVNTTSVSRQE